MKFPSLTSLFESAGRTFLRFPLAILLATAGTVTVIRLAHLAGSSQNISYDRYWNILICCFLGMLLSIALTVPAEQRGWGRGKALGLQSVIMVGVVVFYLLMPAHMGTKALLRYYLFSLGLHLLIAVIGFTGRGRVNGFWLYNKKLFLRILTSALYTSVLYVGLALALLAIDKLFNVDVSYKVYMDLWAVLAGVFNTWFFLAGFPADYENPAEIRDYPKGLKIFTQYVLLPLITVYLLILYAYLFKIVFTAHWPSGWVAYLVLGFSIAGILALLLIYPLRNDEKNRWINGYARCFYFALFPLIVLLGCAIWKRVKAYGITEERYFVLALAGWLFCIALFFLRKREKETYIQVIPLSLCCIAFLSSFGPWGAFSVSLHSQQKRLAGLLEKYGMFSEGKLQPPKGKLAEEDNEQIRNVTEYIVRVHGYKVLQPWFSQDLDSTMRRDSPKYAEGWGDYRGYRQSARILNLMRLGTNSVYGNDAELMIHWFSCEPDVETVVLATGGSDYVIPKINLQDVGSDRIRGALFRIGGDSFFLCLDDAKSRVILSRNVGAGTVEEAEKDSSLVFDLGGMLHGLPATKEYGLKLPLEKLTVVGAGSRWSGQLVISQVNGQEEDGVIKISNLQGTLLLKRIAPGR